MMMMLMYGMCVMVAATLTSFRIHDRREREWIPTSVPTSVQKSCNNFSHASRCTDAAKTSYYHHHHHHRHLFSLLTHLPLYTDIMCMKHARNTFFALRTHNAYFYKIPISYLLHITCRNEKSLGSKSGTALCAGNYIMWQQHKFARFFLVSVFFFVSYFTYFRIAMVIYLPYELYLHSHSLSKSLKLWYLLIQTYSAFVLFCSIVRGKEYLRKSQN